MNKDIIYREDAIKAYNEAIDELVKWQMEEWQLGDFSECEFNTTDCKHIVRKIEAIPSADRPPTATDTVKAIKDAEYRGYMKAVKERPQGEWIGDKCSCCGSERAWYGNNPPYCPDCGCRMKGADNE